MTGDVSNPATWFDKQLEAVAGLQRGDTGPAAEYLRFVEEHRGRQVALDARRSLRKLADSPTFKAAEIINKRRAKAIERATPAKKAPAKGRRR